MQIEHCDLCHAEIKPGTARILRRLIGGEEVVIRLRADAVNMEGTFGYKLDICPNCLKQLIDKIT
jgi:hypothetical protein